MKLRAINGLLVLTGTFFSLSSGTFVVNDPGTNTVPIIFSSGDGKFSDGSTKKVYEVRKGIKWSDLKEGYEKPANDEVIPPTSSLKFDNTWLDGNDENAVNIDANLNNNKSKYYNYTIEESITVYANYGAESFATMSWIDLAKFFTDDGLTKGGNTYKGTSGLASYFNYSYNNHSCPELIGQERYLNYAGEQRKVVVIGFNQDKVDDNKGWGSITFQFVDTITDAPFNYNEDNKYYGSHLEEYLNNAVYNNIEEVVRNQIKEVKKWTYCKDTGKVEMQKEKLFPLSLKEMNVDSPSAHGETKVEGLLNDGGDEQTVHYKFYDRNKDGTYAFPKTGEGRANADPVKKKDINGNKSSYWLRSYDNVADTAYNVDHSYIVDEDGNVGKTQKVNYTCGVAPAFCFGQCDIVKEKFTECDWDTITSIIEDANNNTNNPSSGLAELKAAFSDDDDNTAYPGTFIGLEHDMTMYGVNYKVRVIGEEHDNLTTAVNGVTKAALTFELTHVISNTGNKTYGDVKCTFGGEGSTNYKAGPIQGKCDAALNTAEDANFRKKIKTVNKYYNKNNYTSDDWHSANSTWKPISYSTCAFPLSYLEIGGLASWMCNVRGGRVNKIVSECNESQIDTDTYTSCYTYYNSHAVADSKRVKKNYKSGGSEGSAQAYHLREALEKTTYRSALYRWRCSFGITDVGRFDPNKEDNAGHFFSSDNLWVSFAFCL